MKKQTSLFALIFFVVVSASAQSIHIAFDKDSILIGDHLLLQITLKSTNNSYGILPLFKDSISTFDIIETHKPDTVNNTITQEILLTQFDEGRYQFGKIPALFKNQNGGVDTVYSNIVPLWVQTIEVDTSKAFKPIKPVKSLPFPWKQFAKNTALYGFPILLFLGLLLFYFIKKRKWFAKKEKPKTMMDFYEEALHKLEEINKQKLWQNDQVKEYYFGISEVMRSYLEGRYGIQAMESTTDEIMSQLIVNNKQKESLKQILQHADLAKFAKFKPLAEENMQFMKQSKEFIKQTRPVIKPENNA